MHTTRVLRSREASGNQKIQEGTDNSSKRKIFGDVSNRRSTRSVAKDAESKLSFKLKEKVPANPATASEAIQIQETGSTRDVTARRRSLRSAVIDTRNIEVVHDPASKAQSNAKIKGSDIGTSASNSRKLNSSAAKKVVKKAVKRGRSILQNPEAGPPRKKTRRSASSTTETLVKDENPTEKPALFASSATKESSNSVKGRKTTQAIVMTPRVLCNDFLAETDYSMVCTPHDSTKYTFGISSHDTKHKDNVLMVADYVTDLFQRLYHAELEHQPSAYMNTQEHINPMMRSILVDWLIEVHMKFRLTPETLYLCVNIIDRYCSCVEIDRRKLQLVGVTALLIACKYEEIYPPEVRDCVYITDRAYTRQSVLDMEQDIVKNLKFKLTVPTGYPFLARFLTIIDASGFINHTAHYYMERTLQDYEFLQYRQSLVAAAAVSLALNNSDARKADNFTAPNPGVPTILLKYTGFTKLQILEVAVKIVDRVGEEIVTASSRELVAVKRKYEGKKFGAVALFINPDVSDLN